MRVSRARVPLQCNTATQAVHVSEPGVPSTSPPVCTSTPNNWQQQKPNIYRFNIIIHCKGKQATGAPDTKTGCTCTCDITNKLTTHTTGGAKTARLSTHDMSGFRPRSDQCCCSRRWSPRLQLASTSGHLQTTLQAYKVCCKHRTPSTQQRNPAWQCCCLLLALQGGEACALQGGPGLTAPTHHSCCS